MPLRFMLRYNYSTLFMDIVGIANGGEKTIVRVNGIKLFVDVEKGTNIGEMMYTEKEMLPGKYMSKPKTYLRVEFKKIAERKRFIEDNHKKFFIGNDDKELYLVLRESDINTAGWNIIQKFRIIDVFDKEKLPVQVAANINDIKGVETPEHLIRDRSIICAWDLETYTPNIMGGVPRPENLRDSIKMCAMVFRYYWDKNPLCSIILSVIPMKVPGAHVIVTNDIVGEFKNILKRMQPDFLTGFNDGGYDWPFIKKRINDYEEFTGDVCCTPISKYEKHLAGPMTDTGYIRKKTIKLEAGTPPAVYDAYVMDGCICFDTMVIMRRLNKSETKFGNLNSFLAKYGIAPKEDMHYDVMAKIFYLWEITTPEAISKMDPMSVPFPDDKKTGKIAINRLTAMEISELFEQTDKVGIYCLRDAAACIDLLLKVNTIPDFREFVNKARCPLEDAFYKADGIKVRNCILNAARKEEWGCWPKKYALVFSTYTPYTFGGNKGPKKCFPGGYVRFPEKGVYAKDSDRPCSGLDAESLYPSIIRAFNISPEYLKRKEDDFPDFEFREIKTHYKFKEDPKSSESVISGCFLKSIGHNENNEWRFENFGIIPTLLHRFFLERKEIKKSLFKWEIILEKLTKDAKIAKSVDEAIEILKNRVEAIKKIADGFRGKKKSLELSKIGGYEKAIELITAEKCELNELLDRSQFMFNYFNSKQLTVKVFMNTFYGEMGNTDSPFFIPEMGGSVTKMGRTCIKEIGRYVETKGYHIYYGDTDSIYISAPNEAFAETDLKYKNGEISKEHYYEEMVGITMDKMQEIAGEANAYFLKTYECPFLRMAYEEVLFPFGFFGKKNYFGVKHLNSIDFSLCRTDDKVKFEKEIFSRGMPLRRRDASKFVKAVLIEMLMRFCDMKETRAYGEIIDGVIRSFIEQTLKEPVKFRDLVKKSYSFREPSENANTTQMKFRKKMMRLYLEQQINKGIYLINEGSEAEGRKIFNQFIDQYEREFKTRVDIDLYKVDRDLLELNFEVPGYGERHDLVLARHPPIFTQNGKKDKKSKGYLLEYVHMIGNEHYANYIRNKYIRQGVELLNYGSVDIAFEEYFETLYGTIGRYMLYLYDFKDDIEEKCEALGKKAGYKKAEADQIIKIKRELKEKYKGHYQTIQYNTNGIIEVFGSKIERFKQLAGTGPVSKQILMYFSSEIYEIKHVEKELMKLLNAPQIFTVNVKFNLMNSDRVSAISRIEEDFKKLMNNVMSVCGDINKNAHLVKSLDVKFAELRSRKRLEAAYEIYMQKKTIKKGVYLRVIDDILEEWI